jgi:hypothetical protein
MENENELVAFEKSQAIAIAKIVEYNKLKAELEAKEKEFRNQLEKAMDEYGIKSFSNDLISITRIEEKTSETINVKELEEKAPATFKKLIEKYKKITHTKAYVRISVK